MHAGFSQRFLKTLSVLTSVELNAAITTTLEIDLSAAWKP